MTYSVLSTVKTGSHLDEPMFLGNPVAVARYDKVRYPQIEKLIQKQLGFFWRPEEVELSRDIKDFKSLSPEEEHIFTSNLKRQILLDSVQGRALSLAFGAITSAPELEVWWKTQEFFETIHSRSYSHLIRNVYADPSKVFDTMMDIEEIVDCAKDISIEYDRMIETAAYIQTNGWATEWDPPEHIGFSDYDFKRQIWRTIHAVNFLEGIRFYVSFICSWAFAEQGKMEGNAKIIKMICRDENVHLAATQQIIKLLPKEDPDFARLKIEEEDYIRGMIEKIINQEKTWAGYLFKNGAMLGLNYDILCETVDHYGYKRAQAIGISGFKNVANPLPWTQKWISGAEVQVAPQETQNSMYIVGGVKNDVSRDSFKDLKL